MCSLEVGGGIRSHGECRGRVLGRGGKVYFFTVFSSYFNKAAFSPACLQGLYFTVPSLGLMCPNIEDTKFLGSTSPIGTVTFFSPCIE